jgi:uncharacterized membrane protein YqaE (UPF0057 family)
MKNMRKIKVAAALGFALVLGACGTSNNVVNGNLISKRKHTKGFYLNLPSNNGSDVAKKSEEKIRRKVEVNSYLEFEKEAEVLETVASINDENTFFVGNVLANEDNSSKQNVNFESVKSSKKQVQELSNLNSEESISTPVMKEKLTFKQLKKESKGVETSDILLILLAVFIPFLAPLAVYLHEGQWNTACWVNLVLTILFLIPGIIHAIYVILR